MRYLLLLPYFLLTAILTAQGLPPEIPRLERQVENDGRLDEVVWTELRPITGFHNFWPVNDGPAAMDSEVRIFHDGEMLHVGVRYRDTLPEIRLNSLKRDDYDSSHHLSDCFGLVIDTYGDGNRAYFFGLNGAGTQVDGLIGNFDDLNTGWNAVWWGNAGSEDSHKTYELSIPLRYLNYDPAGGNWRMQFYVRDLKDNQYTTWTKFPRGFLQFDTRHLGDVRVADLSASKDRRYTIIPSLTADFRDDDGPVDDDGLTLKPSLDLQYNLTPGLRLDATINPDFSQIDVDRQVTNLTRFSIIFPERRNFFLENSDLFSGLGTNTAVNPFNSRLIGSTGELAFGVKLSGNVSPRTRIGLLNVQVKPGKDTEAQNYTSLVGRRELNDRFFLTAYLLNRQSTERFSILDDYNRVAGTNLNYVSRDKKWTGLANYGGSFSDGVTGENGFYNLEIARTTRTFKGRAGYENVGENYLTDVGFVPRLYNFDAATGEVVRRGYGHLYNLLEFTSYPKADAINAVRWARLQTDVYFDEAGGVTETNTFFNSALWFKSLSSVYINVYHDDIDLRFAFAPLRNDFRINPGGYSNMAIRAGYNSDNSESFSYSVNAQTGSYYGGMRRRFGVSASYQLLPVAALSADYEYNRLNFTEATVQNLHLVGFTTEIFLTNRLNWTNYVQYNTQGENLNLNSRLQWEYRPLSYVYLVYTDNYDQLLDRRRYGVSFKVNYRLR